MKRNIISVDRDKCVGCGLCTNACHQGALKIIDGKATLISETYCDGLGMCLPNCPMGALKIIEKEVEEFKNKKCPSVQIKELKVKSNINIKDEVKDMGSQLRQWPCQIKLVPTNAPYFNNAKLLIAADCTAFAYGDIHNKFMKNKITLIGCPKLDSVDYSEKLTEIIKNNNIKSVDVLRMSVPCCGGIENAVKQALINSGKMIPWTINVISTNGEILE